MWNLTRMQPLKITPPFGCSPTGSPFPHSFSPVSGLLLVYPSEVAWKLLHVVQIWTILWQGDSIVHFKFFWLLTILGICWIWNRALLFISCHDVLASGDDEQLLILSKSWRKSVTRDSRDWNPLNSPSICSRFWINRFWIRIVCYTFSIIAQEPPHPQPRIKSLTWSKM